MGTQVLPFKTYCAKSHLFSEIWRFGDIRLWCQTTFAGALLMTLKATMNLDQVTKGPSPFHSNLKIPKLATSGTDQTVEASCFSLWFQVWVVGVILELCSPSKPAAQPQQPSRRDCHLNILKFLCSMRFAMRCTTLGLSGMVTRPFT